MSSLHIACIQGARERFTMNRSNVAIGNTISFFSSSFHGCKTHSGTVSFCSPGLNSFSCLPLSCAVSGLGVRSQVCSLLVMTSSPAPTESKGRGSGNWVLGTSCGDVRRGENVLGRDSEGEAVSPSGSCPRRAAVSSQTLWAVLSL